MDSDILEGRCGSSLTSPFNMDGGLLDDNRDLDYIFTSPLDKIYECPVCCNVLRYPVMFEECGHRCCASCLADLVRIASKCPIDQKPFDRETQVVVDKEIQAEIDQLEVKCSYVMKGCTWFGQLKDLKPHMDDCRYVPLMCPQKCGEEIDKAFLKRHLTDECAKRVIKCDFCEMPIKYEDEEKHLTVCGKFLLPCPNNCRKGEIPREEDSLGVVHNEQEVSDDELIGHKISITTIYPILQSLCHVLTEHLEKKCPKEVINCPFYKAGCEFSCVRKNMHKHIKDDPIQHLGMACDTIIEQERTIDEHSLLLEKHTEKLESLARRVDTLEKLYGCQLVWKIENWTEKFNQAKLGKKTTIFSPPFLTNRHGYHMAMSLCPYGDGRARGKFLSIFVCICKGEYDALLPWPFVHRISFTLIDQCQNPEGRRNVTYAIKPNTIKDNKPFLGRPVGDRNASFGAQKFVELDVVKTFDYLRDDCMYIKCTIDSDDMILL